MKISKTPTAASITHEHILGIICTEIHLRQDYFRERGLRILDVGCGNGEMIRYLHQTLLQVFPLLKVAIYGLDIVDSGVQEHAFQSKTLLHLNAAFSDVRWNERLHFISQTQEWPFESEFFDMVLSNQVLEHVSNHDDFFRNQRRVMKDAGIAIHLFPLLEVLWEAHLHLPIAHRITDWDRLSNWIAILSRLGIGKWKRSGMGLGEYATGHADYMLHYTNYINQRCLLQITKRMGFRASFAYSGAFYLRKLKKVCGLNSALQSRRSILLDVLLFPIFKRISSVTLFQIKGNAYKRFE
jgi:SAM-dependent methyltransferase